MTLTAHILHQHKRVSTNKNASAAAPSSSQDSTEPSLNKQQRSSASYIGLLPQQATQNSWNAAQDHLQQALTTALKNPWGESSLKRNDKHHYLNLQKKNTMKQKRNQDNTKGNSSSSSSIPPLQTLSAATAAQNLGVFYKARATTTNDTVRQEWLAQAQDLYQQTLSARTLLLPKGHPDIYITQYSLAELYDYTEQTELANELRNVILDTYDPPTEQQKDMEEHDNDTNQTGGEDKDGDSDDKK
jgi:hypothetical protein